MLCGSACAEPLFLCPAADENIRDCVRRGGLCFFDQVRIIVFRCGNACVSQHPRDGNDIRTTRNQYRRGGIPIVALSQLNRGTDETEQPSLRSLRDSGELEQDAAKVVLLWNIDRTTGTVGVSVAKNRRGATGIVQMHFDGSHMRFYELESEYIPPKPKRIF